MATRRKLAFQGLIKVSSMRFKRCLFFMILILLFSSCGKVRLDYRQKFLGNFQLEKKTTCIVNFETGEREYTIEFADAEFKADDGNETKIILESTVTGRMAFFLYSNGTFYSSMCDEFERPFASFISRDEFFIENIPCYTTGYCEVEIKGLRV